MVEFSPLLEETKYISNNSQNVPYQTWNQYKNSLDRNIEYLEIPNNLQFENNELVIDGYSKLKEIYALHCNLSSIKIENCLQIEIANFHGNNLKELNIDSLSLKHLTVSCNSLRLLDVKKFKFLETLYCFDNCLEILDCSDLTKLTELNCSRNVFSLDPQENEQGKMIRVAKKMNNLNTENCVNLKNIDCDLNNFSKLDFSHLTNLRNISLRQNNYFSWFEINEEKKIIEQFSKKPSVKNTLILNSSHLTHVDVKNSDVKEIVYQTQSKNVKEINNYVDESYLSEREWQEDSPTTWEQDAYERKQQREEEQPELVLPRGQKHLSFWFLLRGEMIIDGQGKGLVNGKPLITPDSLEFINLGNNFLTKVTIKNFPHLKQLIISHNQLVEPPVIINCPLYQALQAEEQAKLPNLTPTQQEQEKKVLYHHQASKTSSHAIPYKAPEWIVVSPTVEEEKPVREKGIKEKVEVITPTTTKATNLNWNYYYLIAGGISVLTMIVFGLRKKIKKLFA